jgi:hypothetical protein
MQYVRLVEGFLRFLGNLKGSSRSGFNLHPELRRLALRLPRVVAVPPSVARQVIAWPSQSSHWRLRRQKQLLSGLCIAACKQKRRVRFATAATLVDETGGGQASTTSRDGTLARLRTDRH